MPEIPPGTSVEEWNDALAHEHDIDAYYRDANPILRWIETRRLKKIRSLVRPRSDELLLEVGCGGGHVLELFPECRLVGVDVSGAMLAKAATRLSGRDVELHKGELDTLHLDPESFDIVICSEVLEHVVDPEAVLDSIASLLKPTGRAVITFPNDPLIRRLKRILKRSGAARLPALRRVDWGGDQYHLHSWTIDGMRSLLAARFDILDEAKAPFALAPVRCCFRVGRLTAD